MVSNTQFPYEILPHRMKQKMINLEDCIVGIMHTLVLNLGKPFLAAIQALSCQTRIWSDNSFPELRQKLSDIGFLSLNWCKVLPLGSKDKPGSSWELENFLAFMTSGKAFCQYSTNTKKGPTIKILQF